MLYKKYFLLFITFAHHLSADVLIIPYAVNPTTQDLSFLLVHHTASKSWKGFWGKTPDEVRQQASNFFTFDHVIQAQFKSPNPTPPSLTLHESNTTIFFVSLTHFVTGKQMYSEAGLHKASNPINDLVWITTQNLIDNIIPQKGNAALAQQLKKVLAINSHLFTQHFSPSSPATQESLIKLAESLQDLTKKVPSSGQKPTPPPTLHAKIALQELPYPTIWVSPTSITQNTSYPLNSPKTDGFEQDCIQLGRTENIKIPQNPSSNAFRVATYNVHFWASPNVVAVKPQRKFEQNQANILKVALGLNANALLLQEVVFDYAIQPLNSAIFTKFFGPTYQAAHSHFCQGDDWKKSAQFGNMILSKSPPLSPMTATTFDSPGPLDADPAHRDERRCFINAKIAFKGLTISLYCLHLDVWVNSGETRAKEIQQILKETNQDTSDIIIIGGDFNSFREQDYSPNIWQDILTSDAKHHLTIKKMPINAQSLYAAIAGIAKETLEPLDRAGFQDSFTFSKQEGPKFTVWTGIVVDFLFIKDQRSDTQKKMRPLKTKSYVYYSAASDHIPVIVDLEIN